MRFESTPVWKKLIKDSRLPVYIGRKLDKSRSLMQYKTSQPPKIDPLKLYYIDPSSIEKTTNVFNDRKFFKLSPILGGDWDKRAEDLKHYDLIYSIEEHFNKGKEWEETDLYKRGLETVENGEKWQGLGKFTKLEEFERYLDNIDDLYQKIKSNGYKTQRKLIKESQKSRPHYAIERDEVTINIGRSGEVIHEGGYHRLGIAKALGLDKMPVRIKVRHSKWEEKRRKRKETVEESLVDNP